MKVHKQHLDPVWRDKANYLLQVKAVEYDGYEKEVWEQLWCRQISEDQFEICCIPFYVYGLFLGDVVKRSSESGEIEVLERSDHWTLRIWFGDAADQVDRIKLFEHLKSFGCELEWYSWNFLALDVASEDLVDPVIRFLEEEKANKALEEYETGWL